MNVKLLLILLITNLLYGCSQQRMQQLHFVSQGQPVNLKVAGEGLVVDQAGQLFRYNQKLLVVTAMRADQLQAQYHQITAVQQLAELHQGLRIYWLTLKPDSFFSLFPLLQNNPELLNVEPDIALQRTRPDPASRQSKNAAPWDIPAKAFSLSEPLFCATPDKAVRVAIIDDGFNFQQPGFAGAHIALEYDADGHRLGQAPEKSWDYHGTKVASVIAAQKNASGEQGLAPDSEIIAISQKSSWASSLVLAFSVAKMMKADVINCSWGLSYMPASLALLIADINQQPQQPQIVLAGGNKPEDACSYNVMSQLPQVLTIGASVSEGKVANFSVRGLCVGIFAPYYIKMIHKADAGYFSGTSSSAAIVSGVLARAKACGIPITVAELAKLWQQQ